MKTTLLFTIAALAISTAMGADEPRRSGISRNSKVVEESNKAEERIRVRGWKEPSLEYGSEEAQEAPVVEGPFQRFLRGFEERSAARSPKAGAPGSQR